MRKILLLSLFAALSIPTFAQFVLTPEGFKVDGDGSKQFIVVECDGKTQQELFNSTQAFINKSYNSPNFVTSNVSNEMITLTAEDEIGFGKMMGAYMAVGNYQYKISTHFKDGRMRIDVPVVSFPYKIANKNIYLSGKTGMASMSIYSQDGKLKEKPAKERIESIVNAVVSALINSVQESSTNDW